MTTVNLINLLDSTFVTSFKHTARVLYSVPFETSNVSVIRDRLKELEYNVTNDINTGKHVGANITSDDVRLVIETLNALVIQYELIHSISAIPSNIKLHQMLRTLRDSEKPNVIDVAKEVVSEILKPVKTGKKLTPKQQLAEAARKKSAERKMQTLQKLSRQGD
jgi:hypothetical protein